MLYTFFKDSQEPFDFFIIQCTLKYLISSRIFFVHNDPISFQSTNAVHEEKIYSNNNVNFAGMQCYCTPPKIHNYQFITNKQLERPVELNIHLVFKICFFSCFNHYSWFLVNFLNRQVTWWWCSTDKRCDISSRSIPFLFLL